MMIRRRLPGCPYPAAAVPPQTSRRAVVALLLILGCADRDTVFVAEPTQDRVRDQSAVAIALDHAVPGDVVQFGAGTYVVGGEFMVVGTPGISLRGHPDGTTLVGCTREERSAMPCNGFMLAGEAQQVSGIRFEGFGAALRVVDPTLAGLPARDLPFVGGQVIEDNHFEDIISLYYFLDADSTVYFRNNVFRDSWHPIVGGGRNIHIVNNDLSVPNPGNMPSGHAGAAIGATAWDGVCESILIEGNRIDGHSDGVVVTFFPNRNGGSSCSHITVRNNEITMRPVYLPAVDSRLSESENAERAGKLAIGSAITLRNDQPLVAAGILEAPGMPEGGWPPALAEGRMSNITVQGNRITGAVGVGIEVVDVSESRIIDNEIDVRPATSAEEQEGLAIGGGNTGPAVWLRLGLFDAVNGMPVWVSEGSHDVVVRNPQ